MVTEKWKQGRKAAYLSDDLPEAASQPPARRSVLEIYLFLPSFLEQIALPLVSQSPPIATKRSDLKSAEMGEAQIWGDLATCPMTSFIPAASMSGGGVTSLVTGPHPPTHSLPGRGGSKAEVREPKADGLEWWKEERNKDRKNAWKLVNLYHVWINCQQY